jgi:hypothetical protein
MGGKRTWIRKHILFCVAVLICLTISGCALFEGQKAKSGVSGERARTETPGEGAQEYLAAGQRSIVQHNYEGALRELQIAFTLSGGKSPGDEALLYLGQVYGDPQNHKKDFSKSIAFLQRVIKEYPQNVSAESARVWMENLKEQERLKRVFSESVQEGERLRRVWNEALQESDRQKRRVAECTQENAKLKKIVEDSKTVDVEMDEKKRNQAK